MIVIFILFLIYLDKKHVQLYFTTQYGHLSAKFAPKNVQKKNVEFELL